MGKGGASWQILVHHPRVKSIPAIESLPAPPPGRRGWPWTEETPTRAAAQTATGHAWPRISVVTPSYDQGEFIEETIRSVLLQGYPNLEYVVVDGGSTDATRVILEKYAPWLDYWVSEKDRGQAHAINKGLDRSTGTIRAYLNSDDIYLPGALQHVGNTFAATGCDVLVGRRKPEPASTNPRDLMRRSYWIGRWRQRKPFVQPYVYNPAGGGYSIPQECVFWNHERLNEMRFDESYHFCMDSWWFSHIYASARIVHTTRRLGMCRVHPDTKTSRMQHVLREELVRKRRELAPYASPVAPSAAEAIRNSYRRSTLAAIVKRLIAPQSDALFTYTHPSHMDSPLPPKQRDGGNG
jgi:hypothetical protein